MSVHTLPMPADLKRELLHNCRLTGGDTLFVEVVPCDEKGRRCAAWCADHYRIWTRHPADTEETLIALEDGLQQIPGVYMTTRLSYSGRLTNPDWPFLVRIPNYGLTVGVFGLIRDEVVK